MKSLFANDKFMPTQWDSEEQKRKFADQFIAFVGSDFSKSKFPKWFYDRLNGTFGHIAHYNQHGFFETFFLDTAGKIRFIEMTLRHGCYGDPAWTYSDVERAIQREVRKLGVLETYQHRLASETEDGERAQLAALKAKYEGATK